MFRHFLSPSPPAEKARATGNQPRQTRAHDRTGDKLTSDLTTRVSCRAQLRTKLLPDGHLDDVSFEDKLASHGLAFGLRVRGRLKWQAA
jgi:hypothetical protein